MEEKQTSRLQSVFNAVSNPKLGQALKNTFFATAIACLLWGTHSHHKAMNAMKQAAESVKSTADVSTQASRDIANKTSSTTEKVQKKAEETLTAVSEALQKKMDAFDDPERVGKFVGAAVTSYLKESTKNEKSNKNSKSNSAAQATPEPIK